MILYEDFHISEFLVLKYLKYPRNTNINGLMKKQTDNYTKSHLPSIIIILVSNLFLQDIKHKFNYIKSQFKLNNNIKL